MKPELRPVREEDGAAFMTYAGDEAVSRQMNPGFPKDGAEWDAVARSFATISAADACVRAVVINEDTVGCIGLFLEKSSGTLAYWLGRPFWSKGFMTELVRMFCEECFGRYEALDLISAEPKPGNHASRRVLEKAGFTCENGACYVLRRSLRANRGT